jgi:hypothetical protein
MILQEHKTMLNWKSAAERCGVTETWLRNQTKAGNGPRYLQPSRKTILFRPADLDEWVAGWKRVGGK